MRNFNAEHTTDFLFMQAYSGINNNVASLVFRFASVVLKDRVT